MRFFLAVFPPPEVQALADRAIQSLRRAGDGVAWVRRENLHVTLRFLGELDAGAAARAEEAAREAGAAHAAFGARLGPAGAFPSARKARVLWFGLLEGAEPMAQLAQSLERSLASRGFEPDAREFAPHLTIGRLRAPGDWTRELVGFAPPFDGLDSRFGVRAIDVVESALSTRGSTYRVRARAPLAGA